MYPRTKNKINEEISGKEYILQHTKRGYRCISWHPHYITTEWCKNRNMAIAIADVEIKNYYDKC
jgi:hypothetical protein